MCIFFSNENIELLSFLSIIHKNFFSFFFVFFVLNIKYLKFFFLLQHYANKKLLFLLENLIFVIMKVEFPEPQKLDLNVVIFNLIIFYLIYPIYFFYSLLFHNI